MIDPIKEHSYSDYIIYGDETGDHSIENIYKEHPVFALALCVFSKHDYIVDVVRRIKKLKFHFWGHDAAILHSAKLRKQIEDFQFLQNQKRREFFIEELNAAIKNSPFTVISAGIDKRLLKEKYSSPENPYALSLEYCLDGIWRFLQEKNQNGKLTHIIIESRGKNFDDELRVSFNKIVEKNMDWQISFPLKIVFVDKKTNSIGLQIADLVAYPIGRFVVNSQSENRAFKIILDKFFKYPDYLGSGLEIFPNEKLSLFPEKRKAPDFSEA